MLSFSKKKNSQKKVLLISLHSNLETFLTKIKTLKNRKPTRRGKAPLVGLAKFGMIQEENDLVIYEEKAPRPHA